MNIQTLYCVVIFLLLFATTSAAQVSMPNTVTACKCRSSIKLDGIADEECWQKAQRVTNFTQRELHEGEPVTERTEAAVVFTPETLYVAFWCYERLPGVLTNKEMKRDFIYWTEDNFEVIFDTFYDKRNGYVFVVNPNGARSDVMIKDEGKGFNMDWDGVWDAEVIRADSGWFGEMAIPFSTLKFSEQTQQVWGVNFERNIRRKQEQAFWQGWSRNYDFEHVSHAGILTGLDSIRGEETIELKPYAAAGIEIRENNPDKTVTKIGGDANYLITPTLKLNLTLNTDFAQVESDRAQINISRFSLYYPEKRQFFLEGANHFNSGLVDRAEIFYSRRIGIADGKEIPIIGGARLMGNSGSSNIGLLSIQTAAHGDLPTTNFSAARFRQNIFEKSSIGVILTGKNAENHYNYVYGGDFFYSTSDVFGDNNLKISAMIAQSVTQGIVNAKNKAYNFVVDYPNDVIDAEMSFQTIEKNFNPEIGFLRRKNFRNLYGKFKWRPRPSFLSWMKRFDFEPFSGGIYWTDDTGEIETAWWEIRPFGFETKSGEIIQFDIKFEHDRVDEGFDVFEDIGIDRGKYDYLSYELEFSTFQGRKVSFSSSVNFGEFYDGERMSLYAQLKANLNRHLNISADFTRNNINLSQGYFYTNNLGGRLEYAFNPKIFSSFFGQWNNETDLVILNFRFNWIPVVGSDFYLAVNQMYSTAGGDFELLYTTVLGKFVWRIGI